MKHLSDLNLQDKKILYRADINSNIVNGEIADDTRIRSIIPSIQKMKQAGAKQIILLAHQGRSSVRSPETVLDLHAKRLEELLKKPVLKFDTCQNLDIPPDVFLVMLENVRLYDENNPDPAKRKAFARMIASYGDVYVNDAFAVCHRDHATISELPKIMSEKVSGPILQREIEHLQPLLNGKFERPFTIVLGGAKVDTKIGLIQQFIPFSDHFLIGGGIANTFLFSEGYDVGSSLYEPDKVEIAREIALKLDSRPDGLVLPEDVVCADSIGEEVMTVDVPVEDVMSNMKILDVGRKTSEVYADIIRRSKTILWNGPMGLIEYSPFRHGSYTIAKAMVESDATTLIGGGESVAVLNMLGIPFEKFTHVSTGGGAMLEYLSGKELPGISALEG